MSEPVLLWGPCLLDLFFYFTLLEEGGDLTSNKHLERNQILDWFCPSRCFVSACPSVGTFSGDENLQLPFHSWMVPWTHWGRASPTPPRGSGDRPCSVASGSGGFHPPVVPGDTTEFAVKRTEREFQCSSVRRADAKGRQEFIQTGKKARSGACLHGYCCLIIRGPHTREAICLTAILSPLSLLQVTSHESGRGRVNRSFYVFIFYNF